MAKSDGIRVIVEALSRARGARLEMFCEKSLVDADGRGVLVHEDGLYYRVELSHQAGWGSIVVHQSRPEGCEACDRFKGEQ